MENLIAKLMELFTIYGIKVLAALAILIIGRWIALGVRKLMHRFMDRSRVDPTIVRFVGNLTYIALLTFFIIAAIGQIGIQTTSFIAVLGAAGLAIGLALQGSLSNFAAGFLMIIFKPFKVGDYIEGAGIAGTVEEIQIFTTLLATPDNKAVIIPNAKLTADNIINYSSKGTRRVDMVFGISYGDDMDKARRIISDLISGHNKILKEPAPQIALLELADSSVNIAVRPWVKVADYWDVYFTITEQVKKAFDQQGISIPFPQQDVHLYEHQK